MSGSVNKVILIGRLCKDPESRQANGKSVCNFSLATNESWRDADGQKQERAEFHRIVVWGKLAEVAAKYLSKGSQVYIEGKLQTREWTDKDGQKKYTTEIVASSLVMLGGKGDGGNDPGKPDSSGIPNNPGGLSPDDLDSIPF